MLDEVSSISCFQEFIIKSSVDEVGSQLLVFSFFENVGTSNKSAFLFTLTLHFLKLNLFFNLALLAALFALESIFSTSSISVLNDNLPLLSERFPSKTYW